MSRHTPGPWKWESGESGACYLNGADGSTVCDDGSAGDEYNRSIDPYGDERNQANARLIAAAPELLEALKGIHRLFAEPSPFFIRKIGGRITNGDQDQIDKAFIALDKAIAKAKGR